MAVEFNADTHQYFLDGEELPSVTHILRFMKADMPKVDPFVLEQAGDRGTRVHEACTDYDMEGDDADIDADILPYVQAYADWKRDYSVGDWELYEHALATDTLSLSGFRFAGTLDRLGWIDGRLTLVDIKTSARLDMATYTAQLSAYMYLLQLHGYDVRDAAILQLKKEKKYRYIPIEHSALDYAYTNGFLQCYILNIYLERAKKNGK